MSYVKLTFLTSQNDFYPFTHADRSRARARGRKTKEFLARKGLKVVNG